MPPFGLQRLLTVPSLLLIGSLASADAITGRVVDANGVGVAGVDIDFVSLGSGGNPHELNDGTNANGDFFTTVDAGIYEIRFYPPSPPATTLLTGVLASVVVTGTKNLGTITLAHGVSVQGTVKNTANQPVGNVRIDVFRVDTGAKLHMKNNLTSAFGTFNLAVPANTQLRSQYLTNSVIGQVLVPRELFGTIPFGLDIGTITLQTGFHVTGIARTQTGSAITGADVDVTILPSGDTLFTPSDNTNGAGVFDVVVPAGTYDLELTRPSALVVVAVDVDALVVNAATDLGVLTMRNGVFLTGTVRNRGGDVVTGVDVNVVEVATGLPIALGSDNTNFAGFYSVVVPTGLLDVVFSPPGPHSVHQKRFLNDVLISGNTTLDAELPGPPRTVAPTTKTPSPVPSGPIILPLGSGIPGGRVGTPFIQGARSNRGTRLTLFGGPANARARLRFGSSEQALTGSPNVHVVQPVVDIPLTLDGSGEAHFLLPDHALRTAEGTIYAQFVVVDPAAVRRLALSHVLSLSSNN